MGDIVKKYNPHMAEKIRDACDRLVRIAERDIRDNGHVRETGRDTGQTTRTGDELVDIVLRGVIPNDIRNGDSAKLIRAFSAIRWLFQTHAMYDDGAGGQPKPEIPVAAGPGPG